MDPGLPSTSQTMFKFRCLGPPDQPASLLRPWRTPAGT
nr:unnamed protein product [Callosobruchus analis]